MGRESSPVVLAVAPPGDGDVLDAPSFLGRMPNIGILYLSAALKREGYPSVTLDRHYDPISPFQMATQILLHNPVLVGFTLFDFTMEFTRDSIRILRMLYDGPIVVGGYTPTFHAREILEHWAEVDFVVVKEGEEAILRLMAHIDGEIGVEDVPNLYYRDGDAIRNTPEGSVVDVTTLPPPAHRWDEPSDVTPLLTRRGCASKCAFCSMVPFYDRAGVGPVRMRPVADVVDEIALCVDNGRRELMFYDDNFGLSTRTEREWCREFIETLDRRNLDFRFGVELRVSDMIRGASLLKDLCRVGLNHIALGVESLLPRQLQLYNKGYKQDSVFQAVDIAVELPCDFQTNVIFWDPWITLDEAVAHTELLDRIRIQDQLSTANFPFYASTLAVRHSTGLYETMVRDGLLRQRQGREFYRYDYDFQDAEVAAFHNEALADFIQRVREGITRPPALWLLVPRLEGAGETKLSAELRRCARGLAEVEFEYFTRLLTVWKDGAPRSELLELHEEMQPRLRSKAEAFPEITQDCLTAL